MDRSHPSAGPASDLEVPPRGPPSAPGASLAGTRSGEPQTDGSHSPVGLPPVDAFAAAIEHAFPHIAIPLDALGAIDPEHRPLLVDALGALATGPGVVAFLGALIWGHDPRLRVSALAALEQYDPAVGFVTSTWLDLASAHPDAEVVLAARRVLSRLPVAAGGVAGEPALRQSPQPVRGLVTALDGSGRALVGLLSQGGGFWVGAVFACDVESGVVEVGGIESSERLGALEYLEGRVLAAPRDVSDGRPELGIAFLRAALTHTGRGSPPALGYWVERCCGRGLTPAPLSARLADALGGDDRPTPVAQCAGELLDALPDWWEDDRLTDELAREAVLRGADPGGDEGAIRILFERRLAGRLDRYRRMLTWMGVYWYASGEPGYSRIAWEFARQLDDPQNAVPRHAWIAEYARRSLRRAAERITHVGEVEAQFPSTLPRRNTAPGKGGP